MMFPTAKMTLFKHGSMPMKRLFTSLRTKANPVVKATLTQRQFVHTALRAQVSYGFGLHVALRSVWSTHTTCHRGWLTNACMAYRHYSSSVVRIQTDLHLSDEVRVAVHSGKPVVALESTIITHGMPYPDNVQTALAVEQVVRENGALPATVAVMRGQICVGLSTENIEWLGSQSTGLLKISRRDLPVAISQGLSGGTTVSGTMIAAHKAGIPLFATGGIGGVHRGVEDTMDVSADLRELGRTPVAVVSAGVKSILDIGRTLEYLETEGVCVVTFGPKPDFPAFFTPHSGHLAPHCVQTAEDAAAIIDTSLRVELNSGMLFAVPIPEEFAASGEVIEAAIQEALLAARVTGVTGRDVTPFILQRVNELTKGASLSANVALVKNNAAVASRIAVALAHRQQNHSIQMPSTPVVPPSSSAQGPSTPKESTAKTGRPVVVGGAVVDFCAKVNEDNVKMSGATYPGQVHQSFGGVGRNVADCLSRLGTVPLFISAIGEDEHATALLNHCAHMDVSGVRTLSGFSTPTYCPVLTGSGHLMFGIGDMEAHAAFSPNMVSEFADALRSAPLVCVDGNFTAQVIERVCQICSQASVPVWFEPTDIHKATKPFETDAWRQLTYTSPNLAEVTCMWSQLTGQTEDTRGDLTTEEMVQRAATYCRDLLQHIPVIILTLGNHGLLLGQASKDGKLSLHVYPSTPPGSEPVPVVNVSGAGDCLNAAVIHFILQGHDLDLSIKAGLLAAQHSLLSHNAVPSSITPAEFTVERVQKWARFEAKDISHLL